ncbi:hypothetical protein C806_00445 [Lachnospiraceae bacterium 3-1]|nr:hypothetical protein C806_00445 [Lachnospiraceae bacterium 3-1]
MNKYQKPYGLFQTEYKKLALTLEKKGFVRLLLGEIILSVLS